MLWYAKGLKPLEETWPPKTPQIYLNFITGILKGLTDHNDEVLVNRCDSGVINGTFSHLDSAISDMIDGAKFNQPNKIAHSISKIGNMTKWLDPWFKPFDTGCFTLIEDIDKVRPMALNVAD